MAATSHPLPCILEEPEQEGPTKKTIPSLIRRLASQARLGRPNKAVPRDLLEIGSLPRRFAGAPGSVSALEVDTSLPQPEDAEDWSPDGRPSASGTTDGAETLRSTSPSSQDVPRVIVIDCAALLESPSDTEPSTESRLNWPVRSLDAQRAHNPYSVSDFTFERTLGIGKFGRVHLVRSRHNSRFYAIKIMSKQKIVLAKEELRVCREQSVLQAVRHPFIVNLWAAFQDSDNLYMVMEFVRGGELGTLLRRSARFPEPVAKYYAAEIALALSYLHDKGIVHRDLNLTNIMLSHDGHIRLVDFGMAKTDTSAMPKSSKNLHYRAPEAIVSERYSTSVDWYALGVLIFEMLYGSPPFYEPNISPAVLHERIVQGTPPIKWPAFHLNAKDLIIKLMVRDPSRRLGNNQNGKGDVFVHRWFREVDWEKLVNKEIRPPYIPQFSDEGDTNAFAQFPGGDDAMDCCGKIGLDLYGERFPAFEYSEALA